MDKLVPGCEKRRRGGLDGENRRRCVNAQWRIAVPGAITPLPLALEDSKDGGSARRVQRLGGEKRRRDKGENGEDNLCGAIAFHKEASTATGSAEWADVFVSKADVVHDALLSALGGRMSASATDVQAYVALRRAPYGTDRVVMASTPDCARTVKRLLYCSDRFRVVRKPGGNSPTGAVTTYEFQLARSGGSVPCTLSMKQLARGQRRTPSPLNRCSGSRRKLPTEHWRAQRNSLPASAPHVFGPVTEAIDMPPTKAARLFQPGKAQETSPLSAPTSCDRVISNVTAEVPENKTASGQAVLDETSFTQSRTATTRPRGDAPPTDTANINPQSDPKTEMGLGDIHTGDVPLDFSAELFALLPTPVQGLPLMNEAEEALSKQLLNFQEWETSFGWSHS